MFLRLANACNQPDFARNLRKSGVFGKPFDPLQDMCFCCHVLTTCRNLDSSASLLRRGLVRASEVGVGIDAPVFRNGFVIGDDAPPIRLRRADVRAIGAL